MQSDLDFLTAAAQLFLTTRDIFYSQLLTTSNDKKEINKALIKKVVCETTWLGKVKQTMNRET